MPPDPRTGPGVPFPPPTLFVGGLALGLLLHRVAPLTLGGPDSAGRELAGILLVLAGLGWTAWGMLTFHRARTAIYPRAAAARLVTWGPYRYGRNPMYVGLGIAYVGGTLLLNMVWPLLLLPLVYVALTALVVRREERHLAARFGDEYADYCARTRRWL